MAFGKYLEILDERELTDEEIDQIMIQRKKRKSNSGSRVKIKDNSFSKEEQRLFDEHSSIWPLFIIAQEMN